MRHLISKQDASFRRQVEACEFPVEKFDHRAHLRLAYIYLAENNPHSSTQLMREALNGLLKSAGVDPDQKYHETLTEAWILAVDHFMHKTESSTSADDFIDQHPIMLDSNIMLTHYSADVLFSENARKAFVEPDLDPIPRYRFS